MKQYSRVSYWDRSQINAMLKREISIAEIAKELGFHKSTIYREIKRNSIVSLKLSRPSYIAQVAQKKAIERLKGQRKPYLIQGVLAEFVEQQIKDHWSPELIAGRYQLEKKKSLSHQTIYRYIKQRRDLKPYLKFINKRGCGRRHQRKVREDRLLSLKQRPTSANKRSRHGHWERDGMYGANRQQLLICLERKSRYARLGLMQSVNAAETNQLTEKLLKREKVLSITNDNGTEFRKPETSQYPIYYCDPFKPHQRGSIENLIGTLRNKIKRTTDLKALTNKQLNDIEDWINKRPRKMFNYRTPYEVYFNKKVALVM